MILFLKIIQNNNNKMNLINFIMNSSKRFLKNNFTRVKCSIKQKISIKVIIFYKFSIVYFIYLLINKKIGFNKLGNNYNNKEY